MTCSDCGEATLSDGVCVDCSNKRFYDYPRLKAENECLRAALKVQVEASENLIKVMNSKQPSHEAVK